jgi:hypothetical protein
MRAGERFNKKEYLQLRVWPTKLSRKIPQQLAPSKMFLGFTDNWPPLRGVVVQPTVGKGGRPSAGAAASQPGPRSNRS